jgi:acyl-CoA thioesterase
MSSASEAASFPLLGLLGISIELVAPGRARAAIEADDSSLNPNGVVHGAVLFAMADTAMGAATMSTLVDGKACASIDVQMRFLRPAVEGSLIAEASVLRAGQRVVQLESRVVDAGGDLVAMATGSFAVCPQRKPRASGSRGQ